MSTHASVTMRSRDYVFDPRPRFPFLIVAKRYWVGESVHSVVNDHETFSKTRQDIRTLVFMHGNGCYKEHWEPTLQRLFENAERASRTSVRFRDMWTFDLPNHGDSAILNEEILRCGFDTSPLWASNVRVVPWETHARGVHAFLAGIGTGVDVDFSKRRLAIVGHCAGALEAVLTSTLHPLLKISSLHLISPSLLGDKVKRGTSYEADEPKQWQDVWSDPDEVLQTLSTQPVFREWDERILKLLIRYGLWPLPTADYLERMDGVTLECTKKQQTVNEQASSYGPRSIRIGRTYLHHVVNDIQTHVGYGDIIDTVPCELQSEALRAVSWGTSSFASVTMTPGVGHLAVQSHPDIVADVIWRQLEQSPVHSYRMAAKL